MKTLIITLLSALLICAAAQAGETQSGIRGYGLKLGVGFSTLGTEQATFQELDSFGGGTFGAFVEYGLTPQVSIQTEFLFAARGAGGAFLRGRSFRHDYVEIPVLLKYGTSGAGKWRPSLFAGPAVSFLFSGEFKSSWLTDDVDTKDFAKSVDFGIVFGGAIDYHRLLLDIRYTVGMVNTYDPAKWNALLESEDADHRYHMTADDYLRNRSLVFTLGFRIGSGS